MPPRFSMQLYSARNHPPPGAMLRKLADMGYAEVEGFGGIYGEPEALRAELNQVGLTMPSGHFSIDMLEKEKPMVLKTASALGMNKLVCPFLAERQRPGTAKGWRDFGRRLEAISRRYRQEGFGFAWHNHDFEFTALEGGGTPHEMMFSAAPTLDWEVDVAWIVRAKSNPLKWIKDYAGVITLAHVKDMAPEGACVDEDGWSDVGYGVMKWPAIMAALRQTRCMHYVLEHDNPADFERFAQRSLGSAMKYQ